jgi:probable addiction module antidote protein
MYYSWIRTDNCHLEATSGEKLGMSDADAKLLFRDNPEAIAHYLTDAFAQNELSAVATALKQVVRAQNVQALAREAGLRRDRLYHTFGGKIDPQLGRVLKLLEGLNVRLTAVPLPPKQRPPRPKLGRPTKPK